MFDWRDQVDERNENKPDLAVLGEDLACPVISAPRSQTAYKCG